MSVVRQPMVAQSSIGLVLKVNQSNLHNSECKPVSFITFSTVFTCFICLLDM